MYSGHHSLRVHNAYHQALSPNADGWNDYAPMYVIYGSDTYPVDTSNPENILAQRVQGTEYTYAPIRPWTARKYFAVTAIDRCGNESEAIQQQ